MTNIIHVDNDQLRQLLQHGFDALSAGRIEYAGRVCQDILTIKPDLVPAHFLVGLVALAAKDRVTAFQAFGSVTKLDPDHGAAWAQLAKLCMSEGQVNRADVALAEASRCQPDDPLVQDLLGTVYSLMGEYELAAQWFQRAVSKQPDHPGYLLNLANNHVYHGAIDRAVALFERIIAVQVRSPQAHWALSSAQRATDTRHIDQMRALAETPQLHPRLQSFYYYGIGKEYEDLERWDEAFAAFSRGAAARRLTVEYDEAAEREMFEFLQAHYTREWFEQGNRGPLDPAPIFILGQPRTGTTLIERIVGSHSQVRAAGELQQFNLAIRRLSEHREPKRFSAGLFANALRIDPEKLGTLYLETTRRMRGAAPRFIDKLPQNYLCVPLLLKALPNAKILHLTRNPMDACFASFKQLFADAYLHSYDQQEMARHHARYRQLMQSWRCRFPGQFLDVSYEETTQDVQSGARRIIDFLDLPWEDQCLDFHRSAAAVATASAVQVREPAHTRSVNRWRKYERQLQPMLVALHNAGVERFQTP